MTKSVPWVRLAAEGILIIVSILIAFSLDAWWDSVRSQAQEAELLAAIEQNLEDSQTELRRVRDFNERGRRALDAFFEGSPQRLVELDPDTADSLLRGLLGMATFQPFDGAIRAGDLSIVRHGRIRWALSAWLGHTDDVMEDGPLLHKRRQDLEDIVSLSALAYLPGAAPAWSHLRDARSGSSTQILHKWRQDESILKAIVLKAGVQSISDEKLARLEASTGELLGLLRATR